jgi:hypothetical protein
MSIPLEALITAGAGIFGSAALYAGTRFAAKGTAATENRKVKLTEFEAFKTAYYERIEEFEDRYKVQEEKMTRVEGLLRLALKHIVDLRADMRRHDVNPTKGTPPELETLLWTLSDDEVQARQGE